MMSALVATAMTLGELLGSAAGEHRAIEVRDLALDSREVTPGAAFIAIPGATGHGLGHAAEASARGASVVVYEPSPGYAEPPTPSVAVAGLRARLGELANTFYWRASEPPRLTGVTGTNGKTTVAYLVAQALTRLDGACGYVGTLGAGTPPRLRGQRLTTPDCLTLHRTLRALGTRSAAVEVSSHALAQDRVAGLTFETAVFTNLSRDHLDHHGDLERYGRAKARLFERPGLETAVLNLDDGHVRALSTRLAASVDVLGTSLTGAAAAVLHGRLRSATLAGVDLDVGGRYGTGRIRSPLIGEFNAENLLSALGVLLARDLPLDAACAALAECRPAPGRMEVFGGAGLPAVVVDYAHTPAALERALASLRPFAARELICVFGCGGERDAGKRPQMGAAAARLADRIVLTDDNPRAEDPGQIVADIRRGLAGDAPVRVMHDRRAAIMTVVSQAAAGDVVLVAGKGHETVQDLGAERRPFEDRRVVGEALEART